MAEDYDAYINAEFVDMVTNETWDFPTPYWEVDDNEDIFPMGIAQNFFIIFPTVIEALDEFIEQLKRNGDNGNEFTGY
tara:strand:+ start:15584 stop:15817 length:234 start_codon:yes stop_codon:yes gene_type:complete